MTKSKVPKTNIKKKPERPDAIQTIHEEQWPYKYVIWYPTPDNKDVPIYGLMAVKFLMVRDIKTNKVNAKVVWDYQSDEGLLGKKKSVWGINSKTGEKDIFAPIEVAEFYLEKLKKGLEKIGGYSDPEIVDFSCCKSYEECFEKLMNDERLKFIRCDEIHRRF